MYKTADTAAEALHIPSDAVLVASTGVIGMQLPMDRITAGVKKLAGQLCESLLQFEDAWERKQLNIETDITDDVRICSDAELLSLVWNNLISNAVKFDDKGMLRVVLTGYESEEAARADMAIVRATDKLYSGSWLKHF